VLGRLLEGEDQGQRIDERERKIEGRGYNEVEKTKDASVGGGEAQGLIATGNQASPIENGTARRW